MTKRKVKLLVNGYQLLVSRKKQFCGIDEWRARSKEQGARSKEPGVGSSKHGAGETRLRN
jgi:hypothetical protein